MWETKFQYHIKQEVKIYNFVFGILHFTSVDKREENETLWTEW
jgi:hypothetical protein